MMRRSSIIKRGLSAREIDVGGIIKRGLSAREIDVEQPTLDPSKDEDDEITEPSEETTTQVDTKEDNGDVGAAIFGYLALPLVIFSLIDCVWDTVFFALGYNFDYNTVEVVLQRVDEPDVDDSPASIRSLNVHSIAGIVALVLVSFQLISGLVFSSRVNHDGGNSEDSRKTDSNLRQGHRRAGRLAALAWTIAILTGVFYLLFSQRIRDKQFDWTIPEKTVHRIFHMGSGTISLINLQNGIVAAVRKDYVLHKGSMYFAFYWMALVSVFKFVRSVVAYFATCEINALTLLLIPAVTFSIEFTVYTWLGYRYGGQAFRRTFVTYNLAGLGCLLVSGWSSVLFRLLINPPEKGCLAGGLL
jgi:uncharacterized membrane protein YozB (DUF420 family)